MVITNEQLSQEHRDIVSTIRNYGDKAVRSLNDIYEAEKTLSDNQAVIDEKIKSLQNQISNLNNKIDKLMGLLPGR